MKRDNLAYCFVILCCVLFLGGCVSAATSPTPRFYTLQSLDENQVSQKFSIPSSLIIKLGPVRIPEYQNRPQIVTQDKERMLTFAQFDRWGEPLESALSRVISEDLRHMLPSSTIEMRSWDLAMPVKYHVIIDIVQLESELDKDLFLAAQWSVIDVQSKKVLFMKRSEFRQEIIPHNYAGLSKTLSALCISLSKEIAERLALLANQPEIKEQPKQ